MSTSRTQPYRSVWTHMYDVPFRQDWVDAGGIRTRYVNAGPKHAPTVITLHGTAGSWENCVANIGPLSKHFNVLGIDMIGSGLTDKPPQNYEIPVYTKHVRDFMDAMDIQRTSFIGVSLGSWIAARFALENPQRTDKIVFISAAGVSASSATGNEAKEIRTRRTDATDSPTWDSVRNVFAHLFHDESQIPDDLVALRLGIYSKPEMRAAMPRILSIIEPDIFARNVLTEQECRRMTAPSLLIASVDHQDMFLKATYEYARLLPNARVVEVPRTRHWAQFEDYETFNRVVTEFLLQK